MVGYRVRENHPPGGGWSQPARMRGRAARLGTEEKTRDFHFRFPLLFSSIVFALFD